MSALVCAACRKPVERTFDDDFQHESVSDGLACTAWPVRAARAVAAACTEAAEALERLAAEATDTHPATPAPMAEPKRED